MDMPVLEGKDSIKEMDIKNKNIRKANIGKWNIRNSVRKDREEYLHHIMSLSGGFLAVYSLLCRCKNLGLAQTANMLQLLQALFGGNLGEFFIRLAGLLLYSFGILLCTFFSRKKLFSMQRYAILVNVSGLVFLSLLPLEMDPVMGILPIFFMASTQWSVFCGTKRYSSSTIFSSNNLRQCISSWGEYLVTKDGAMRLKSQFYAQTLFWYHLGALLSIFTCKWFGVYAALILIPVQLFAWFLTLEFVGRQSLEIKGQKTV